MPKEQNQRELHLLIVEDETIVAMDLEDILSDLGHEVLGVAATLKQALRFIEERSTDIDAVVLDANLAGVSSAPVAVVLQQHQIPYIVASGYGSEELRAQGLDGPMVGKPYEIHEIEASLLNI
ncbi:response regulator [Yoonia sp.]|uniref:response regulator n=1 Tax=Yoonia sp. TaxID=2212373 RepID=UPI00391B8947